MTLTTFALAAFLALLIIAAFVFAVQSLDRKLQSQASAMNQQVDQSLTKVQEELRHHSSLFQSANATIGDRLQGTALLVGQVQNRLGQLEEANRRILDMGTTLGREVGGLQSILQSPKIRGGWGELFLGDLLDQVLGPEHYELQFPFKNGERVDAIVKLAQGMVPIDAKFPLENFRKYLASENENDRKNHRKEFYRDVKKHIDQIAEKYLVPDEGTLDFALMYIPAENVYYETIVRDDELGEIKSVSNYAQLRKVIPVSPNTLYVYLASIARGLQGLKIEMHAKEILANIQRMAGDLAKFDDEFRKMGAHIRNAAGCYERSSRQFERIQDKFSLNAVTETVKLEEKELI